MDTQTLVRKLRACAVQKRKGEEVSGARLACVLREIITREIEEGGPYAGVPGDPSTVDEELNVSIAEFLSAYQVYLPGLDAYLADARLLVSGDAVAGNSSLENEIPALSVSEVKLYASIWAAAERRLSRLPVYTQSRVRVVIERTIRGNPDKQMSLMSSYVRDALGPAGKQSTDELLGQLGFANICFWTAFIIYDDFWDEDEAADPQLLPVANLLARHFTEFSSSLQLGPDFESFCRTTMDRVDCANAWETQACRMQVNGTHIEIPCEIPGFGKEDQMKYYPAAGHVIGPVVLLLKAGFVLNSLKVRAFILYSKHYLIAMQMNDDAHDWKEDLARGHISMMVAALLRAWKEKYPDRTGLDLEEDMGELERLYWYEVLGPFCHSILEHARRARLALIRANFSGNTKSLEDLITRNEILAEDALQRIAQTKEFLAHFINTPDSP